MGKNHLALLETERPFLGHSVQSLVAVPTELGVRTVRKRELREKMKRMKATKEV
jgi:hypothetical protein